VDPHYHSAPSAEDGRGQTAEFVKNLVPQGEIMGLHEREGVTRKVKGRGKLRERG